MSPTFSSLPGRRHDLHDADRADLALGILIEARLLVALRGHQQVIELVPVAVLPEELRRWRGTSSAPPRMRRSSRTSCFTR